MRIPREFYIPKGAIKVADRHSDAVAYVHTNARGKPCGMVFFGKQSKPVVNYQFRSEAERERVIRDYFGRKQAWDARKREARDEAKAFQHAAKVGDLYRTSWGYDQTNVEFFEIIEIRGKHAILRELQQVRETTGWEQGRCVPQSGKYVEPRYEGDKHGEPIRRLIQDGRIKIDDVRTAWPWGKRVAGAVVGAPVGWTNYA